MRTKEEISKSLKDIRDAIETDIIDVDIDMQKNKLLKLTQLIGLSAECNASAKKLLHLKELQVLKNMPDLAPSKANALLKAECYEEASMLEYADRLNSALVHSIDAIRSVISLYKTELENSLKQ